LWVSVPLPAGRQTLGVAIDLGQFMQVARHIVVELQLLKVQRSVAPQDDEWQDLAAAVTGLQSLTGWSQSESVYRTMADHDLMSTRVRNPHEARPAPSRARTYTVSGLEDTGALG
jgi:uncharacterized membrane protein